MKKMARIAVLGSLVALSKLGYASKVERNDFHHYQGRLASSSSNGLRPNSLVMIKEKGKEHQDAQAKKDPNTVALTLKKLIAHKTSEKRGDEIYVDILTYGHNVKPKHYLVPPPPHHWPTAIIDKIKDVKLWQGVVEKQQKVTLIVSLLDKDAPPWDRNDMIGAFKVDMERDGNGIVNLTYSNLGEDGLKEQHQKQFSKKVKMNGDDGEYTMVVIME